MKKLHKMFLMAVSVLCMTVLAGCGNDGDGSGGGETSYNELLLGSWVMEDITPYDNEYVETISFDKNGRVDGYFKEGDGDLSHFSGTYTLLDKDLTIRAVWMDEADEDVETWNVTIMAASKDELMIRINYGDGYTAVMTFVRANGGSGNVSYQELLPGEWRINDISPEENEYVHSIAFDKNGKVNGYFKESDGELSHFTGIYSLEGKSLTIYARWTEEGDSEAEIWDCTILSLSKTEAIIRMTSGGDYSVTMEFVRK